MNKEQAIQLILQAHSRGRSVEDISIELSHRLSAPLEITRRFVNQVLAVYAPLPRPSSAAPAELAEISMAEQEAMVLEGILKNVPRNDLILRLCDQAGMDWGEAEKMVARIELESHRKVIRRNTLIFVPASVLSVLFGVALIWLNTEATLAILFRLLAIPSSSDPMPIVILQNAPLFFVIGTGLFAGGTIGLFKALQEYFAT